MPSASDLTEQQTKVTRRCPRCIANPPPRTTINGRSVKKVYYDTAGIPKRERHKMLNILSGQIPETQRHLLPCSAPEIKALRAGSHKRYRPGLRPSGAGLHRDHRRLRRNPAPESTSRSPRSLCLGRMGQISGFLQSVVG